MRKKSFDNVARLAIEDAEKRIRLRLDEQNWKCVYPCGDGINGGKIKPGDKLARCYDGYGICHLKCAMIGIAPKRKTTNA